jgi:peptide chain release factor 2
MQRLETLRQLLHTWQHLQQRLHDTRELIELGEESLRPELTAEVQAIQAEVRQLDLQMMLSGPHDASNAIFAIHTGAGGVDAQDFAEMIMRMYLRWCDANAFTAEIVDQSPGDSAGIKSVVMTINGHNAYGYLKAEAGVHRLVRLSPFDANHRRHTSFVLVEVLPEIAEAGEVDLNPNDLRIDVYRAASAGGQNVQKNATAIRITHLPTGIVVTCQNERSQAQNRDSALRVLRARLYEIQLRQREQEIANIKGDYTKAEWGSQIRSYVLHPYQMVKDHRTEYETGNTQAVLDGDLNAFIEAYLRSTAGNADKDVP